MSNPFTAFMARAIAKASDDLVAAFERIPEDKRAWSPMGDARTALDQVAECAMLNGSTADLMRSRTWPEDFDMSQYFEAKAKVVAMGWPAIQQMLKENTAKAIAAVNELNAEDLGQAINMPWGPMTVEQIASYPYWNMCYHEGQINYIASMLGCLE